MINKLSYRNFYVELLRKSTLLIAVMLTVMLGSCSDDKESNEPEKPTPSGPSAKWDESEIKLEEGQKEFIATFHWQSTLWEIIVDPADDGSEFVTNVTPVKGGDASNDGLNTQKVRINFSTKAKRTRSQKLRLVSKADNTESHLTVTQEVSGDGVLINVNTAGRLQQVVGFGGMLNPVIWCGNNLLNQRDLETTYSPEALGYTVMRLMIYPNEYNWRSDVEPAKTALRYGATVYACPWVAPDAMTEKIKRDGKEIPHLKKDCYEAYADHLVKYVNYMRENGVELEAISVQNEPDMDFMYWTPQELVSFVREYGSKIRATGVKLMAPEGCGFQPEYTDPVINDTEAFANTDIIVGHLYQGFTDHSSTYVKNRHDYVASLRGRIGGKQWWMTEHLFNDGENESDPEKWQFHKWDYTLEHLGLELHMAMAAGCSSYSYWYTKRFYGLLGDTDKRSPVGEGQISKNGYILSHYSKSASRRNRVEVAAIEDEFILATAYLDERTGNLGLVILNMDTSSTDVTISAGDYSGAKAWATTSSADMADVKCTVSNRGVALELPARSIVSVEITK